MGLISNRSFWAQRHAFCGSLVKEPPATNTSSLVYPVPTPSQMTLTWPLSILNTKTSKEGMRHLFFSSQDIASLCACCAYSRSLAVFPRKVGNVSVADGSALVQRNYSGLTVQPLLHWDNKCPTVGLEKGTAPAIDYDIL